jgi:hypothetical protein
MVITLKISCLFSRQVRLTTLVNFQPELLPLGGQFSTGANKKHLNDEYLQLFHHALGA